MACGVEVFTRPKSPIGKPHIEMRTDNYKM